MKAPPFLQHLRTDERGRPVPYINLWGPEDVARLTIRPDPNVYNRPALFLDDSAETVPDFFRQNLQRQRECMARGLCQVCGRPVPWIRRLLVVSSVSVQVITEAGRRMVVLTEPWLDPECAGFAIEKCPGLIRRKTAKDLTLVAVTSPKLCQLTVSSGWVEGPLEAVARRVQPAMWAKVLLG
jgi:hypothetical protein